MTERPEPHRTRRRGAALEDAIHAATLAELTSVGYGRLSIEGVAARAGTGKAALYRRWTNKQELVLAALRHSLPQFPQPDPARSPRDNLLTMFTALCEVLSGKTAFPDIRMIGEVIRHPDLRDILAEAVVAPRVRLIQSIVDSAVEDGVVPAHAVTPLTAHIGPGLILQTFLLTGHAPDDDELALIADTVLRHQTTSAP